MNRCTVWILKNWKKRIVSSKLPRPTLQAEENKLFNGRYFTNHPESFSADVIIDTDGHHSLVCPADPPDAHEANVDVVVPENPPDFPDHPRLVDLPAENQASFQAHVDSERADAAQVGLPVLDPPFHGDLAGVGYRAREPRLGVGDPELDRLHGPLRRAVEESPLLGYRQASLLGDEVGVDQVDEDAGDRLDESFSGHGSEEPRVEVVGVSGWAVCYPHRFYSAPARDQLYDQPP